MNSIHWLYHNLVYAPLKAVGLRPRSSQWRTVRKQFLSEHPACAACGGTESLTVHHIVPFHVDISKELDPDNLLVLCEKYGCHLRIGHLLSWQSYNVDARKDAKIWLDKIKNRP